MINLRKTLAQLTGTLRRPARQADPLHAPDATAFSPPPQAAGRNAGSVTLAQEILARLLLELPAHHSAFVTALADDDYGRLREYAHKLAGAVAYCELPALAAALAELRRALGSGDARQIRQTCNRATGCMAELMARTGAPLP